MIWAIIAAVLGSAGIAWALKFGRTKPTGRHRAGNTNEPIAELPGDDDQFRRWRTIPVHIRRRANAENQATKEHP